MKSTKVRVKKLFKDIHTGKIHEVGEEFRVTEKRFNEITTKGDFVEKIEEQQPPENSKNQTAQTASV